MTNQLMFKNLQSLAQLGRFPPECGGSQQFVVLTILRGMPHRTNRTKPYGYGSIPINTIFSGL